MKGSIKRTCYCKDADGKDLGTRCPELRASSKHGVWEIRDRLLTTAGYRAFRRRGFVTKSAAGEFRDRVYALIGAANGDDRSTRKIGDLIFDATKRGGELPLLEDVRRRLGLGQDLRHGQTTGEWLEKWFAGKLRLRSSTARSYRQHLDHYWVPQIGHVPLDRLNTQHVGGVFATIEAWNVEILTAAAERRRPVLEGDIRSRSKVVGVATQHRILATLHNALRSAVKQRQILWNAADAVELPEAEDHEREVYSPEQVATFLDHVDRVGDPLALAWRIVLLRGFRRGEILGLGRDDVALDTGRATIVRTLLQESGKLVWGKPKTKSGKREVSLGPDLTVRLREHLNQQAQHRQEWGDAYEDHGLIYCREDGTPWPPDKVTARFKRLAAEAGLPPIRLHDGRHSAATLGLEAGLDIKIVSAQLGHANTAITQNLYQHVRVAVADEAAASVESLVARRARKDQDAAQDKAAGS